MTPDFSVRAGRTVLSSFLFSDTRKVGYAIPWVRPPIDLYSLVPITGSDGVDARYQFQAGGVVNTTVGSYGSTHSDEPAGESEARRQWAITDTLLYGPLTVYATYHEAHLTVSSLNVFFNLFRSFGAQGIAIADRYDENGKLVQFLGLGGDYDPGKWFIVRVLQRVCTKVAEPGSNTSRCGGDQGCDVEYRVVEDGQKALHDVSARRKSESPLAKPNWEE